MEKAESLAYIAYEHNIDPVYIDKNLNSPYTSKKRTIATIDKRLDLYYIDRAKAVLNFIYEQNFPKGTKKIVYAGKSITVSPSLYTLIEKLIKIVNKKSPHELFPEIERSLAKSLRDTGKDIIDETERQIFTALDSALTDDLPLSKYVRLEFVKQQRQNFTSTIAQPFSKPLFPKGICDIIAEYGYERRMYLSSTDIEEEKAMQKQLKNS